jgi:thiamine monophosphate kinase
MCQDPGWTLRMAFEPTGFPPSCRHPAAAQLPSDAVAALVADTRARGADPDFFTAGARWEREADIPDAVYFRALEAVG